MNVGGSNKNTSFNGFWLGVRRKLLVTEGADYNGALAPRSFLPDKEVRV